jgi:hypothetical protein
MSISPASSDERSPLLSNLTTNYYESTQSSASLPAEVEFPQQEGVIQGLGPVVELNFRLFVSLLNDSVPGKLSNY